ncbi:hypothetical protein SESBI_41289 [Sesbania bispinosa]|nr:hypothetical protein SESBI_41289 [Sesbania bispinosa]
MRPSFVVSLLILSLLLTKAQGIRLRKGSLEVQQQKQHDEENTLLKRSNTNAEEATLCKDEQCTGKIKNRKLVTTSVSTSTTTQSLSKSVKNKEDKANLSVNGNTRNVNVHGGMEQVKKSTLTASKHRDLPQEHYPDPVEITEMDYSPAKRKPPIHN